MLSEHSPVLGKSTQWSGKARERCSSPSSTFPEQEHLLMAEEHKHCGRGHPWWDLWLSGAHCPVGRCSNWHCQGELPLQNWREGQKLADLRLGALYIPCFRVMLIFCSLLNSRASAKETFHVKTSLTSWIQKIKKSFHPLRHGQTGLSWIFVYYYKPRKKM